MPKLPNQSQGSSLCGPGPCVWDEVGGAVPLTHSAGSGCIWKSYRTGGDGLLPPKVTSTHPRGLILAPAEQAGDRHSGPTHCHRSRGTCDPESEWHNVSSLQITATGTSFLQFTLKNPKTTSGCATEAREAAQGRFGVGGGSPPQSGPVCPSLPPPALFMGDGMRHQQAQRGVAGSWLVPFGYLVTCWLVRFQPDVQRQVRYCCRSIMAT